jgi:hypothetical protein
MVSVSGKRQVSPVASPESSSGNLQALQELDPRNVLLVIPCSKSKRAGGSTPRMEVAPWPATLLTAREGNRQAAGMDERQLMLAWRRYSGGFYTAAEASLRNAVSDSTPLIILSGGYGLLHAKEPIGDYNKIMRLADWPTGLLEGLLVAEARNRNVSDVVVFAATSSDYAKLARRVPWRRAGLSAFLVTIKGVSGGASGEVPRRLGRAFTCFWQRRPIKEYPPGTTAERLA